MCYKQHQKQGGYMINFVLVAVIFSCLLGGFIYLLKQRGEQIRSKELASLVEKQKTNNNPIKGNPTPIKEPEGNDEDEMNIDEQQELPATGMEFGFYKLAVIFLLVFTSTSFIGSRISLKNIIR